MANMSNEELLANAKLIVEKSLMDTTALATAGKLNPVQATAFIDFVIDVTALSGQVRVARFNNETMDIDKIGLGARVTMPADEAVAPSHRVGVTHTKVTLQPKELITPFEISQSYLENNIEGESVETTIVRMMATQTGNDIEELLINGYTEGPARLQSDMPIGGSTTQYVKDTFMALFNGWLRLADSANLYDALGADISTTVFSRMIMKMPNKFRRVRRDLRFLASLDHEQLYREKWATRATAGGDAASSGETALTPFGIPLVGIPLIESEPIVVEHFTVGAPGATYSLRYAPIGTSVVITLQTLAATPVTPFVEGGAYTVNRTTGVVTDVAGGLTGNFKVTYVSRGQVLLTHFTNLIFGIGRDVTIGRDEDIYRRTRQYAITTKVAATIEEATAVVKGINVGIN